jgi:hypothetical protein
MIHLIHELERRGIKKIDIKKILIYFSAIATIAGGILHFVMIGPTLKPENFPLQLLPYTDTLFLISGIIQIFLAIPILEIWKIRWHVFGICWTLLLTGLLVFTRVPNMITGPALIDHNPVAFLTEIFQITYIVVTVIIIEINIREKSKN